jgi:hypothetical protein
MFGVRDPPPAYLIDVQSSQHRPLPDALHRPVPNSAARYCRIVSGLRSVPASHESTPRLTSRYILSSVLLAARRTAQTTVLRVAHGSGMVDGEVIRACNGRSDVATRGRRGLRSRFVRCASELGRARGASAHRAESDRTTRPRSPPGPAQVRPWCSSQKAHMPRQVREWAGHPR